jgi:hypothetical protein
MYVCKVNFGAKPYHPICRKFNNTLTILTAELQCYIGDSRRK